MYIHSKYKYFDSTVQRAEDSRSFIFAVCRLPFAVNILLNLPNKFKMSGNCPNCKLASNFCVHINNMGK